MYTGQRHNANNNLSPSSHPSSQIPADAGWLAGWLEQPLHGGLVLSRRGWPPAFLAHNASGTGRCGLPSVRGGRVPHTSGGGVPLSPSGLHPGAIILPCSSAPSFSERRRGEDVLGRHMSRLDVERRDPRPSRCSRTGKPSSWRSRSRASDYRL